MRLQVQDGDRERVVAASFGASATVADLASELRLDDTAALVVDGVVHLSDTNLSDIALVEGSSVSSLGARSANRSGIGRTWVGVAGGPAAGDLRRLDSIGQVSIGRGPLNDLVLDNDTVSERHAMIEQHPGGDLVIEDLASHNGTWVDGAYVKKPTTFTAESSIRIGSSTIAVRPIATDDQPIGMSAPHADDAGRILFNRPPRGPVPGGAAPIALPDQPAERANPTLTIVSLIVPLIFAVVMVTALGSWRYALFGVLSPVMALGNWLSGRRRVRRERTGDIRTHRRALNNLENALDETVAVERLRARQVGPDLLEVRRRIELPSNRLWERRPHDVDALTIRLGVGTSAAKPATTFAGHQPPVDVQELVDAYSTLENIELLTDLRVGPLGLVGEAAMSAASGRALLLQLATHHGPADYQMAILTTSSRLSEWRSLQWLPHIADTSGGVNILCGEAASVWASALQDRVQAAGESGAQIQNNWILVIDDVDLLHRRSSPARRLLEASAQGIHGIVLTTTVDELPASVMSVAKFEPHDGTFSLTHPAAPGFVDTGILDTVPIGIANDLARQLARFEDPEYSLIDGALPQRCDVGDLFGEIPGASAIGRLWETSKQQEALSAPIGLAESGPLTLDLVADGPHVLIAGTTGAGKSELLRTLVISLACNHDPDDLVFVLIDYKGGSAFDRCAELPHVVGVVTDLDEHLGERALLSMEAELRNRERQLREDGAQDIIEYRKNGSRRGPLPRLVVMIDEFATLRSELPNFVSALIGIAQRGRSLGVHLVLATQRPSGAVDANIKANTNLRIALRVQDTSDSVDVIDTSAAAAISRTLPGRAYVRRGGGDLIGVQTAYVSGAADAELPQVQVGECVVGSGHGPRFSSRDVLEGSSVLEELVAHVNEAAACHETPRRPWLEPLPSTVGVTIAHSIDQLEPGDGTDGVVLAIGDDPSQQRWVTRGWNPNEGSAAVLGVLGSGVSTTLRSAAISFGSPGGDRPTWVFPVDCAAGGLAGIDAYPHIASVIEATDIERQSRLLQFLAQELDTRRSSPPARQAQVPRIVVVVDGIASFAESNDLQTGTPDGDRWTRIVRDGAAVGIVVLAGGTGRAELPRIMGTCIRQYIVLEQGAPSDYVDLGVRSKALPHFVPGRCLIDDMVCQLIIWEDSLTPVMCDSIEPPPEILALPEIIDSSELAHAKTLIGPNLVIPIGVDAASRSVTRLTIRQGEHAVVAGPSGSGRTTALRLLASQLRAADPELVLIAIAPRLPAPLLEVDVFDAGGTVGDLEHLLDHAPSDPRRWVIVVDDADRIDIDDGPLLDLAKNTNPNVTIIGSLRSSTARQSYGHWTRFLRASGTGLLLQPDNGVDGELLGVRLPRAERVPAIPGRGYLVGGGDAHLIQTCR